MELDRAFAEVQDLVNTCADEEAREAWAIVLQCAVAPAQQATNRPMPQLLDKLEAVRVMLSGPGAVPNDERAMAYDELDSVIEQLRQ